MVVTGLPEAPVVSSAVCGACGHRNKSGAKFCERCGATAASPSVPASVPTPDRTALRDSGAAPATLTRPLRLTTSAFTAEAATRTPAPPAAAATPVSGKRRGPLNFALLLLALAVLGTAGFWLWSEQENERHAKDSVEAPEPEPEPPQMPTAPDAIEPLPSPAPAKSVEDAIVPEPSSATGSPPPAAELELQPPATAPVPQEAQPPSEPAPPIAAEPAPAAPEPKPAPPVAKRREPAATPRSRPTVPAPKPAPAPAPSAPALPALDPAIAALNEKARACLLDKRFDCAISSAEAVLTLDAGNRLAALIRDQARFGQREALRRIDIQ